MKKITPLNNQILVEVKQKEDCITKAGLLIPATGALNSNVATVLEVSEDITNIKKNDKVLLDNFGGIDFPDPNDSKKKLRLVQFKEVIGIIKEE